MLSRRCYWQSLNTNYIFNAEIIMNQPQPTSNAQMSQHLATQGARATAIGFETQVKEWFQTNARRMQNLCGSAEDAKRVLLAALQSVSKTPSLMECTFESFTVCLLQSAELRLFPGAMQECAYVPFNNNKKRCKEATFIIQYQGLCQLLYRSGMVKAIRAEIVCEKDYFEYKRGSLERLTFEPFDGNLEDRGEWLGVYCIIENTFGGQHIKYMTAKEVMAIKARSRASGSSESPWNSKFVSDIAWMWMKTCLKQNAKFVPKSAVLAAALVQDGDGAEEEQSRGIDLGSVARSIEGDARKAIDAPSVELEMPEQRDLQQSNLVTANLSETQKR